MTTLLLPASTKLQLTNLSPSRHLESHNNLPKEALQTSISPDTGDVFARKAISKSQHEAHPGFPPELLWTTKSITTRQTTTI